MNYLQNIGLKIKGFFVRVGAIPVKSIVKYIGIGIVLVWIVIAGVRLDYALFGWGTAGEGMFAGSCNVQGVNIHGMIVPYTTEGMLATDDDMVDSESIVAFLDEIKNDDTVQAVLIEVDSFGGYPVAGEEIAQAIRDLGKPTVAVIRTAGVSAGYMVASSADHVIASKYSDIGGIGVTASYVQNDGAGKNFIDLSSGRYKDVGDPDRVITAEERSVIMRDVVKTHEQFIADVAEYRGLTVGAVTALADGSTMMGEMALQQGLIDEIGSWDAAEAYLEQVLGEKVSVCW